MSFPHFWQITLVNISMLSIGNNHNFKKLYIFMKSNINLHTLYPTYKRPWKIPGYILFPLAQASIWLRGCLLIMGLQCICSRRARQGSQKAQVELAVPLQADKTRAVEIVRKAVPATPELQGQIKIAVEPVVNHTTPKAVMLQLVGEGDGEELGKISACFQPC